MLKLITEVYIGDLAVKLYFNLLASLKTTDFLKNKNKFSQFFSLGKAVEKLEKNVNVLKVLTEQIFVKMIAVFMMDFAGTLEYVHKKATYAL